MNHINARVSYAKFCIKEARQTGWDPRRSIEDLVVAMAIRDSIRYVSRARNERELQGIDFDPGAVWRSIGDVEL